MSERSGVISIPIEEEMKNSYLNYAMSVIVSRALPDARDGLKPVHRRILYSMNEMGMHHSVSFRKSVHVVGHVMAHYHPHGDAAVYESMVRMAQTFSLRIPVLDSQGNFGSIDGDPPAAMRYTETRLAAIAEEMLRDIKSDTVDFQANHDNSSKEPTVLPTALPFLLVNGSSGIAVGMATNIPPYNLREVCNAIQALIDNPELEDLAILNYIKGPDFPTAGIICGVSGMRQVAQSGQGRIITRSRYHLEELSGGRESIVVTEIPYQVNKADLIVKIASLVREKRIDGISDLRDESDKEGLRVVIELRRNIAPEVIMNQLYIHTNLQTSFHVNNLALLKGKPQLFNLKGLLQTFIEHRFEVVQRRCLFELKVAREREHMLRGLYIAQKNIREIVQLIQAAKNGQEAKEELIKRFELSEKQAQAILEMRLQRLTSLEVEKMEKEINELVQRISHLEGLLADPQKIYQIIREETAALSKKYGTERRSEISAIELGDVDLETLIQEEDMVTLVSNQGYVKRISVSQYKEQARGGKGSKSATLREEEYVEHLFVANTHHYILFISSFGKAYFLKVYEIPEGSRSSKGRHLRTLLQLEENEEITAAVALQEFSNDSFILMSTKQAVVKRVSTYSLRNARKKGVRAIELDENDFLNSAILTAGQQQVILITREGRGLRLDESSIRVMGRTARGVRGIRLRDQDYLIGVSPVKEGMENLLVTERGYAKRLVSDALREHGRATMGQNVYKITAKTGKLVGALCVQQGDALLAISQQGKTIRVNVASVSEQGRAASGVRLLNVEQDDQLKAISLIPPEDEELQKGTLEDE